MLHYIKYCYCFCAKLTEIGKVLKVYQMQEYIYSVSSNYSILANCGKYLNITDFMKYRLITVVQIVIN